MGNRAIVWRRPNVIDGERQWEEYTYTLPASGTFSLVNSSPKRRVRTLANNGAFLELEYNSNTNVYITGALRDGGAAMTNATWTSHKFSGDNKRLDIAHVERDTMADTCTLTAYCSRQPSGIAKKQWRLTPDKQGFLIFKLGSIIGLRLRLPRTLQRFVRYGCSSLMVQERRGIEFTDP